jgi:hypothetical protein
LTAHNCTSELDLPHDDYSAGFRVGWEAVHGNVHPQPKLVPMSPRLTQLGFSRFTMGVRSGIEAAMGIEDLDELAYGSAKR